MDDSRRRSRKTFFIVVAALIGASCASLSAPRWEQLPEPAPMPAPMVSGYAPVNGVSIYYAEYGSGPPVLLLHGGLGSGEHWGNQIEDLSRKHKLIVVDERGHGRSTRDDRPFSYHLMAEDTLALLDYLKIDHAALVGWSDGGNIGLDIAINHPGRLAQLIAFGANFDTSGLIRNASPSSTFAAAIPRAEAIFKNLSPPPHDFSALLDSDQDMWRREPHFTEDQLRSIRTPTLIMDGDREEAIKLDHTKLLAELIPGARLVVLHDVSHFAMWQDPRSFNAALLAFLDKTG